MRIFLPVEFNGTRYMCRLRSDSREWLNVSHHWIVSPGGHKRILIVPEWFFKDNQKVKDSVRVTITNGKLRWHPDRPPTGRGGTVFILESPHQHEYHGRTAKVPLNKPLSRKMFKDNLKSRVLKVINALGVPIPDGEVVLCNPVPYQSSLHRLYKAMSSGRLPVLQHDIRDEVWKALYRIPAIRIEFEQRLTVTYQPNLVINACTAKLQPYVQQTLDTLVGNGALAAGLAKTNHPSGWHRNISVSVLRKPLAMPAAVHPHLRRQYVKLPGTGRGAQQSGRWIASN